MNDLSRSLRLGFAGTPEFAVSALDALRTTQHSIAAVFTQPDRPAGRGQAMQMSPVKRRALEFGLDVHQPPSFKTPEPLRLLQSLQLDALIVVAYGLILPLAVLGVPRLGCFNIHASLLPRWRGAAPIQRAILAGDATTGVTIMRMEAGLDTGPMLRIGVIPIGAADTAQDIHDRLAALGGRLMCETLDMVANGLAGATPQPAMGVSYAEKILKGEALIDWHHPAEHILRKVLAFNPWPIAETRWNGAQVRIWSAELVPGAAAPGAPPGTVVAVANTGIDVACGSGVLRILKLQLAGRKALAAPDFIRSQRLTDVRFAAA